MSNKWTALLLLATLLTFGVGSCLNDNEPAYMKSIYVAKEGYDGISIYFILADASGRSTTADGTVDLTIRDGESNRLLYANEWNVTKDDFVEATLGMGSFQHTDTICNIGRISYSEMNNVPDDEYAHGDVRVEFTTGNTTLSGEETIYFN